MGWNPNIPTPGEFLRLMTYGFDPNRDWSRLIGSAEYYIAYCLSHYKLCNNYSSVIAMACILTAFDCKDVIEEFRDLKPKEINKMRRLYQVEIVSTLIGS